LSGQQFSSEDARRGVDWSDVHIGEGAFDRVVPETRGPAEAIKGLVEFPKSARTGAGAVRRRANEIAFIGREEGLKECLFDVGVE